ncbi:hypothetical protein IWX92DRAFT_354329 [Phyllosticta citricarpa]
MEDHGTALAAQYILMGSTVLLFRWPQSLHAAQLCKPGRVVTSASSTYSRLCLPWAGLNTMRCPRIFAAIFRHHEY